MNRKRKYFAVLDRARQAKNVLFASLAFFMLCVVWFMSFTASISMAATLPESSEKNVFSTDQEDTSPFNEHILWGSFEDYEILILEFMSKDGYYTYAPNQEGVFPTRITLEQEQEFENLTSQEPNEYEENANLQRGVSAQRAQNSLFASQPIILYPIGIKKADPINPQVQIYAYVDRFLLYLLFPKGYVNAVKKQQIENKILPFVLNFSFLACTNERCMPAKKRIPLDFRDIQLQELQKILSREDFLEFQKLFAGVLVEDQLQNQASLEEGGNKSTHTKKARSKAQESKIQDSEVEVTGDVRDKTAEALIDEFLFSPRPLNSSLEVQSFFKALLFGLLAGFILNFMPCVLPVIGLKIRSFLQSEEEPTKRIATFKAHNIFFALGILTWFMVLGVLLGVLGFSWGELFQKPSVVLALLLFIFAMALSLFGIFHLPMFGTKLATALTQKPTSSLQAPKLLKPVKKTADEKTLSLTPKNQHQSDLARSKESTLLGSRNALLETHSAKFSAFASGLLATLLATPCSGPLLGAVLGYSLTQPLPVLLTIFLSMGLGMALPYLVFACFPKMVRFMPRAGNWLGNMEKILAFFLIATSIYLFSLLPNEWQTSSLVLIFFLSISCTLWGKLGSFHSKGLKKALISVVCALLLIVPACVLFHPKDKNLWEDFSLQNFQSLLGKEVLVVKFTADWCPTCKVLEHTVFTDKNMQELGSDVRFIYVDLTKFEDVKQNLLKSLDSVSIPLLAVFPKGEDAYTPIIIRDMYTLAHVKEAIRLAK